MLIKHRLTANVVISITALLIMISLLIYTLKTAKMDLLIAESIGAVESSVLKLRKYEKDFLASKNMESANKFDQGIGELKGKVNTVKQGFESIDIESPVIGQIIQVLDNYQKHFAEIVELQKNIGLHSKDGLYGELSRSVNDVEKLIGKNDFRLLSSMLQLRHDEKDFMLRLDGKYVKRLEENSQKLISDVKASSLTTEHKQQVLQLIDNYTNSFINLVNEQERLGFSANEGVQGDMSNVVEQVEQKLAQLIDIAHEVTEEHNEFAYIFATVTFISVFIITITFAWFTNRTVLKGISDLNYTMDKVSNTNNLTINMSDEGKDEFANVARAFNRMLASFRQLIVEVSNSVDTLNEASGNLAINIDDTNTGIMTQMQETDLVATAITEMVATIDEIANNTNDAASKTETINQNAVSGQSSVDQTLEQMQSLSQQLENSEVVVQELAKDSVTIGNVLDVIRSIAEQTNLLALNAAIEAARAGEQGRGFAVVADEVRTLASRTQESTQEIESIVSSLQGRTQDIVEHMASCRSQGQESAEQANIAGNILQSIAQDVANMVDMNSAIASAIHQQSTVATEVNKHIVTIRDVTESSVKTVNENVVMSKELTEQAKVLRSEVDRFSC